MRARLFYAIPLLLVVLFARANLAAAPATWHLTVQTYSFHEHTSETYLYNTTPGVGVIRRHDNWLEGAGIFRNSVGRWAGYGYVGWQAPLVTLPAGPLRLGGIAGATHHYNFNNGGIVPLGAAVLTVPVSRDVAIDLVGIPRIKSATYATVNVSVSWRFK